MGHITEAANRSGTKNISTTVEKEQQKLTQLAEPTQPDIVAFRLFHIGKTFSFNLESQTLATILDNFKTLSRNAESLPNTDRSTSREFLMHHGVWNKNLEVQPNNGHVASSLVVQLLSGVKGEAQLTNGYLWTLIENFNTSDGTEEKRKQYRDLFIQSATLSIDKLRRSVPKRNSRDAWQIVYDGMRSNPGTFFDTFTSIP